MRSLTELDNKITAASKDIYALIDKITDEQSFVETDKFIGSGTSLGYAAGEGVVSGIASVDDIQVGIFAINGKVLLGGIGKSNAEKISKCVANAVKMSAPVIGVIDTSGARFAEGIEALEGYGKIIEAFSGAYGMVPTILVVKGNNFGSLSYLPAMCDFTVCYEKSVSATSSPLILAAQSTADVASVGTAKIMAENGVSSFTVKNDGELGELIKKLLNTLTVDFIDTEDDGNRVSDLAGETDVRKIIANVFDKGTFIEVKKDYAPEVVTGFARLNGISVGVVAGNPAEKDGCLTPPGAEKVTDLVNTLESFNIPLVNLVNSKGTKNCLKCQPKLMKNIGEMMYALNVASIEKIAVIVGDALGAAYVAFAGKSVYDYVAAWDSAKIGMLDGTQSARLVYGDQIAKADDVSLAEKQFAETYENDNMAAVCVTEKGFIDNVIDPDFTRQYLIAALQAYINKR